MGPEHDPQEALKGVLGVSKSHSVAKCTVCQNILSYISEEGGCIEADQLSHLIMLEGGDEEDVGHMVDLTFPGTGFLRLQKPIFGTETYRLTESSIKLLGIESAVISNKKPSFIVLDKHEPLTQKITELAQILNTGNHHQAIKAEYELAKMGADAAMPFLETIGSYTAKQRIEQAIKEKRIKWDTKYASLVILDASRKILTKRGFVPPLTHS
jgi:hypothetical protein